MAKRRALTSYRPNLPDIKLLPAVASLRTVLPTERRNITARKALLRRIRREFDEMPGLSLTLAQAAKLFGVSPEACSRILLRLVEEHFLRVTINGRYVLANE